MTKNSTDMAGGHERCTKSKDLALWAFEVYILHREAQWSLQCLHETKLPAYDPDRARLFVRRHGRVKPFLSGGVRGTPYMLLLGEKPHMSCASVRWSLSPSLLLSLSESLFVGVGHCLFVGDCLSTCTLQMSLLVVSDQVWYLFLSVTHDDGSSSSALQTSNHLHIHGSIVSLTVVRQVSFSQFRQHCHCHCHRHFLLIIGCWWSFCGHHSSVVCSL